jgi:UDP-2-acetamido-2-deoxy-ribo-hexuluronate aminotransferase
LLPNREAMQKRLAEAGIPSAVHYPVPLNDQPAYKHLCCPDCTPVAKFLALNVLSLPFGPYVRNKQIEKIISEIVK